MKNYQVIIIGGGPAGAATALYLLKLGIKPILLEKAAFPRYHIGESLTGEAGGCLRDLGVDHLMSEQKFPIKHGVVVYGPTGGESFWVPVMKRDEAKQLQPATTWQVRRSTFDKLLLDAAIERGADVIPAAATATLQDNGRLSGLTIRTENGTEEKVRSEMVVDASGQTTFLANQCRLMGEKERGNYSKQVAVFSQVKQAVRETEQGAANTLIFYEKKNHWAWLIPIDDEITSVGVVVPREYFSAQRLSPADFLRSELMTMNPELTKRVPDLTFVEETRSASNYSYHIKQFTGPGFLCVGDSHRFIDPIFSFGVNFALKEAQFASEVVAMHLSGDPGATSALSAYQSLSERGQDIIQDLVDVFWDYPMRFLVLTHHPRHRDEMIDIFAGRIFLEEVFKSAAYNALRQCVVKHAAVTS
ncbi:MAG TPA: tryptophan 7-halogenase [Chthoniobacterales bacterium]|jgi:flavin-dependent dehydrogenase